MSPPQKHERSSPRSEFKVTICEFMNDQWKSIPLKIVLLTFSGGAICIFPFLVLHLKDLGLTFNDIAVIFLLIPFASLLGPICSGLIADKIGKYNLVFVCNIILAGVFYNVLLIVPPIERSPEPVTIFCDVDGMMLQFDSCSKCLAEKFDVVNNLTIKNCQPCSEEECNESPSSSISSSTFMQGEEVEVNWSPNNQTMSNSFCIGGLSNFIYTPVVNSSESSNWYEIDGDCNFKCEASGTIIDECGATSSSTSFTFYMALFIMFASNIFVSSAFTMVDATVLQFVKEHNVSLGKQKIMTMFGFGLTPILAGLLIDIHSEKVGYRSYFPAFMLANALMSITCFMTYFVSIKVDVNESNILKGFGKLVSRLEVDLFLLLAIILGCNFGFIESYLFIYLQSLNASNFLLGLTMTVGCLSSIPMLFCSDWLQEKIGRHFIFLVCFIAYAARMFGYSFIVNPWMCLIFETLEAITYQLMWVTCLKLCPLLAPKGLLATMTGLTGAIHYSFGRGIGGFIGGRLISAIGIRNAFRAFGGLALGGGIFYLVIHYAYLKKKIEQREREIEEEENTTKKKEGKRMLSGQAESPPSYDEAQANIDLLQHSFLALAAHHPRQSMDAGFFPTCPNEMSSSSEESEELKEEEATTNTLLNGSLPHLYVADAYNTLGTVNLSELSKSESNINK